MHIIKRNLVIYVLIFLKWILIVLLLFLAISFLYYFAPAKRTDFKFFSPGSTLATLLFILTSLGFSAYVNNFGQYNKLVWIDRDAYGYPGMALSQLNSNSHWI